MNHTLETRPNMERIHTLTPLPVMDWLFTDTQGHRHIFFGDEMKWTLPTLDWIVDEPAGDETPEYGHYECKRCRERIVPRFLSQPNREFLINKGTSYFVDGERVSILEYHQFMLQMAMHRVQMVADEAERKEASASEALKQLDAALKDCDHIKQLIAKLPA